MAAAENKELRILRSKAAALEELLEVLERTVQEQSEKLYVEISERKEAEAELIALQGQLMETSRRAGMADVATGVLHNVGNALNSVNVSVSVISENLKKSRIPGLTKAMSLFKDHVDDLAAFLTNDEKGRQLPKYLHLLGEHLIKEQEEIFCEVRLLSENLDHIKDIVSAQQNFAKVSGVVEKISLKELAEDALKIAAGSFSRHNIEAMREYIDDPVIFIDKHKLMQILVNLISNARHALKDSAKQDRRLTIRTKLDRQGFAQIEIEDNGIGIPPENLTKIFAHGFTTKTDGHGFGLHSSALAVKELFGSLSVRSQGAGKGAVFMVELPLRPREG